MSIQLHDSLQVAEEKKALPTVLAYNRIDGPGSSLDLSEFQEALWRLPNIPEQDDPARKWTENLPRTVGITIDTGTRIEAHPFHPDMIGVKSVEYETEVTAIPGEVAPVRENWLLKIMEIFNLSGVKFVLENLREGIQSSGLGGSSTATIGVCILANELAGQPFSKIQLISLASRIEQGFGVSITGTQEQSNVMYGGVTDYVWFPWGKPGLADTGYGHSLRYRLLPPEDYPLLEERMAIFHTGKPRFSSEVNLAWRKALLTGEGYSLHSQKMEEMVGDCKLIYRADRTDLSKNVIRGFQAYDLFLEKYPEWKGKVKFIATLMPSRQDIKIYQEYTAKIEELVKEINQKHGDGEWQPIKYICQGDYELVVALLKRYDVLMVNPILDGMNIVAKEGSVVNQNNGVLVLSTGAGCYEELKDGALCINPFDVKQTAESINNALILDDKTKTQLISNARKAIENNDLNRWVSDQLNDIKIVINEKAKIRSDETPEQARLELN